MVEFVRVTAGLAACTLQVTIGDGGDGTSAVGIVYVITPVSDEGERVAAARFGSGELLGSVRWWETSLNHYLRAGECLRTSAAH
jgi:hypothetical protein